MIFVSIWRPVSMTAVCPGKAEHRPLWRTLYDTMAQALWQTAQPLRQRTSGASLTDRWTSPCSDARLAWTSAGVT